jgi:predicted phosphodiesterase
VARDTNQNPALRAKVVELYQQHQNYRQVAGQLGCAESTVKYHWRAHLLEQVERHAGALGQTPVVMVDRTTAPRLPEPAPEAGGPVLPEPVKLSYEPFVIDTPGWWLSISDLHLPYHDKATIEAAVSEAKSKNVAGVLLNGDIFDCYQLSNHYKEPDKGRFREELDCGRGFFAWLRSRFPDKRIVWKFGNHDERLRRYLAERAPALFDVQECDLPALAHCDEYGIEVVADKRVVELGKLSVVHGHEFARGGGVMPARWLFLRGGATALCGHFHQQSQYTFRTLDRREISVWSTGCACFLSPAWLPNNQWSHGYAMVEVASDGWFSVHNRRVLNGRVV